MSSKESVTTPQEEVINRRFLWHLKGFVNFAHALNIDIAIVGGIPTEAYLGKPVKALRGASGAMRDIDALGIGPSKEKIIDFNSRMKWLLSLHDDAPETGVEPLFFGLPDKTRFPTYLLTRTIVDTTDNKRNFYLQFGDVIQKIQASTMQIVKVNYGGVSLPVLRPETTALRYFLRNPVGVLKPKDVTKVKELMDLITGTNPYAFISGEYDEYFDFMIAVAEKYPLHGWLFNTFWNTPLQQFSNLRSANKLKEALNLT